MREGYDKGEHRYGQHNCQERSPGLPVNPGIRSRRVIRTSWNDCVLPAALDKSGPEYNNYRDEEEERQGNGNHVEDEGRGALSK